MARKKGKRRTALERPRVAPERPRPSETGKAEPTATAPATRAAAEAAEPRLPVVGIGASAGGLAAFRKFFSNMPADSGLAFVLIPHLDPSHESLMVDLLARSTAMAVVEAEEDTPVEADRVYILPPNKYMTISGGKLHLTGPVERGGLQTSIDLFLRSLAEDRQEQAIGIVLSGTGAHGTLGLKAIKANGGMAMVQDPGTAEYDSMPRSAIATGQSDYILPPEQMPQALMRYVQHFSVTSDPADEAVEEAYLDQVLVLLRTRAELDFRCYRKKTLLRRARRRMGLHHIDQIPAYLAFLRDHPEEITRLAKDLLISVTSFFRDREVFQALEGQVIPQLIRAKNADESLRLWVPGCATGEEAYSIAMLLIEQLASAQKACRLQVFATDVAEDALEVARRGCYPESITADVSAERLGRFFIPTDRHSYQVNKQLREAITFAAQNVLGDPPFSKLDLISCRNLLIYLEPEVQKKLVKLFHFALREEGYLLLGPSETVGQQADLFETVSKKLRVYRRVGACRSERVDFPILATDEHSGASRRMAESAEAQPAASSTEQLETELTATRGKLRHTIGQLEGSNEDLKASNEEMMSMNEELQAANEELETSKEELQSLNEELSTVNTQLQDKVEELRAAAEHLRRLATVLTDSNDAVIVRDLQGGITAWNHGATRMYGYTEAEALHMNVERLLPEELRPDADGLLERLRRGERVDSLETRRLAKDGRVIDVWLTGTPLRDDTGQIVAVALTARDVTERRRVRESLERLVKERTAQLEAANRALQADITERQKAKEENLRLTAELRHRVEELQALLDVLPVGVGIASDPDCLGVRGNHFATEFLQLPPNANMSTSAPPDERPAYKVCRGGRELTPPEQPMRQACARNTIIRDAEEDIVLPDGQVRTVSVSASPLHDQAGNVRGCVGVFWDVTERKRALRESRDRLAVIANTAMEGIITIDERGTIESVNPSAERMFGYTRAEMVGQNVKILMPPPFREEHDNFLARYLKTGTKKIIGIGREVSGRRKDGSTFFLDLAVSELHDGNRRLFTGIVRDVTERKALEKEVLEIAATEQRRIGHDLHDTAGQELTALGLMADTLVAALNDHSPTDVPLAAKILQGLRRTLSHVRALSRGLVPVEVSAHGLMAALADLTARINEESGVSCTFACEEPVPVEDNTTATHLYRIAQEAVSNALKHGQGKHIEVGLGFTDGLLTLRIVDDGVGMRNQGAKAEGLGLRIMRYRADFIRAILSLSSPAQGGTLVTCTLSENISHDPKEK